MIGGGGDPPRRPGRADGPRSRPAYALECLGALQEHQERALPRREGPGPDRDREDGPGSLPGRDNGLGEVLRYGEQGKLPPL